MRCYCDNPGGRSTLKTKYGNVKLKPGRGKKKRKNIKERRSTIEARANEKVKVNFERVGEKN